jgi:hypothetical protein
MQSRIRSWVGSSIPKTIFPSILKEALLMAIAHFKEQIIDVELDFQLVFLLTFVQSFVD